MEESKGRRISALLFTVLTLGMIAVFTVLNLHLAGEPLGSLTAGSIPFSSFVKKVQKAYPEDFSGKTGFLEINGLYARVTGRRVYNQVVLLKNGMLSRTQDEQDEVSLATLTWEFSQYLLEKDIPFLFVRAPAKVDLAGELFPDGVETYQNVCSDDLLAMLTYCGIQTLDLRPLVAATPEDVERYFYRTDHHWSPDGALVSVQPIAEAMEALLGEDLDLTYADPSLWEKHTVEDWFLGMHGRRVGTLFAGTDDLVYYTPLFETSMSCAIPIERMLYAGDFSDANIREKYINVRDLYYSSAYSVYVGEDPPLSQHRNASAPNDRKVLLIKDSFALPIQAFLSTLFTEVEVIDPRYFTQCTVAEYVDYYQPDIVVLLNNPSSDYSDFYSPLDPTVAEERESYQWREEALVVPERIELSATKSVSRNAVVASVPELEPGKRYVLRFEDVQFTQGSSDGIAVTLYDTTTWEQLATGVFDVEYCRTHGGFTWTFDVPYETEHEMQLLLYGGMPGETAGVGTVFEGVSLHVLEKAGWSGEEAG